MQTLEQLQAQHAKQIAALQAQTAIAESIASAGLPVPDYIGGKLYGAIGITYRNKRADSKDTGRSIGDGMRSLVKAIDLFELFPVVVPMNILKDDCCVIAPEKTMPEKDSKYRGKRDMYRSGDYAVMLRVSHSHESHMGAGTKAEIEFFAIIADRLYCVSIEFGEGYIGACPRLRPLVRESRGYRNNLESRSFEPCAEITSQADSRVSFGHGGHIGPVKTGSDERFLFVAETHDENLSALECEHARECLRTIAEQTGA